MFQGYEGQGAGIWYYSGNLGSGSEKGYSGNREIGKIERSGSPVKRVMIFSRHKSPMLILNFSIFLLFPLYLVKKNQLKTREMY